MSNMINGFFPGEVYPSYTLGGCIDVFENIWPDVDQTIQIVEEECISSDSDMNWVRAETIGAGLDQNLRTNYNLAITHSAQYYNNIVAQNIHNQMQFLLLSSTIPYAKKHDISFLNPEGFNMIKYSGGQEYKAHADGSTADGRCVSAIVYLNDDYVGGEVEFVNFNIKIKPKPGMLLLFPSNYAYRHIAHPVTDGVKYAIVTWLKDR